MPKPSPRKRGPVVECWKCSGTGRVWWAMHYAAGVCFECSGSGRLEAYAPSVEEQRKLFRNGLPHHRTIQVAQCLTPKGYVIIEGTSTNGGAFQVVEQLQGKARSQTIARHSSPDAAADYRAAWTAARAHATANGLTFVPGLYMDTRGLPSECLDKIKRHARKFLAQHAPRFGFDPNAPEPARD